MLKTKQIMMINSIGNIVLENDFQLEKGDNNIKINTLKINQGLYYLLMNIEGEIVQIGTVIKE
jgi:hypothetical protein